MKKTVLRSYAKLIATVGINVQKGQEVFVAAELDQPEFVKMVVEECYRAGAKRVIVDWNYQPLDKIQIRWRSQKNLGTVADWEEARWKHYLDEIPCRIYLVSEDPDGLKGVNQEKMAKAQQSRYKVIKPYRDQIENKYQWCIAAVPGAAWAKKLFPELSKGQAIEKLWEAILDASRVDDDPVAAWNAHNEDLAKRCAYLNSLGIETLVYKSSNGTDLRVGMIPEAEFKAAVKPLSRASSSTRTFPPRRSSSPRCAARRRASSTPRSRFPIKVSSSRISPSALKAARRSRSTPKRTKSC